MDLKQLKNKANTMLPKKQLGIPRVLACSPWRTAPEPDQGFGSKEQLPVKLTTPDRCTQWNPDHGALCALMCTRKRWCGRALGVGAVSITSHRYTRWEVSSLNLELTNWLDQLAGELRAGQLPVSAPHWRLQTCAVMLTFSVWGIQTQVVVLIEKP